MTVASDFLATTLATLCSSLHAAATTSEGEPRASEADVELSSAPWPPVWEGRQVDPARPTEIVTSTSQDPLPLATIGRVDSKPLTEVCVSSRSSFTSVGTHSSYASGEERPLLRGWLHGALGILVLPVALVTTTLELSLRIIPSRWTPMEILLAGKLMSCTASGVLHLYPFQGGEAVRRALMVDIVMIPVSIGVSVFPFIRTSDEALVNAAIQAVFVALTAAEVVRRSRSRNLSIEGGGFRICLILTQWMGSVCVAGLRAGFESPLWVAMLLTYLLGFLSYMKPLGRMPWHRPGWYGWHEDFHTLLLLGDLLLIVLAAHFILDHHPP